MSLDLHRQVVETMMDADEPFGEVETFIDEAVALDQDEKAADGGRHRTETPLSRFRLREWVVPTDRGAMGSLGQSGPETRTSGEDWIWEGTRRRPDMDPRRRAVARQLRWPGPASTDGTDPSALSRQVAILEATCRRHEVTLNALLEATVELRRANMALTAENATLRTRNSVSMVEQVRRTPRGRPRLLFDAERTTP